MYYACNRIYANYRVMNQNKKKNNELFSDKGMFLLDAFLCFGKYVFTALHKS